MREEIWPAERPVPFTLTDRGVAAVMPPAEQGAAVWSGPTRSAEDAARLLARHGRDLAEARAMVRAYQDEASARLGVPVHGWGLDDADVAAIEADADVHIRQRTGEEERRAQLARWHSDDMANADDPALGREPS
ncbi:MAG: hypothetical protein L0K86_21430 [Actinomycetia bacterium]|nr:hypothetical protein [Actinomycetes bacterium]